MTDAADIGSALVFAFVIAGIVITLCKGMWRGIRALARGGDQ